MQSLKLGHSAHESPARKWHLTDTHQNLVAPLATHQLLFYNVNALKPATDLFCRSHVRRSVGKCSSPCLLHMRLIPLVPFAWFALFPEGGHLLFPWVPDQQGEAELRQLRCDKVSHGSKQSLSVDDVGGRYLSREKQGEITPCWLVLQDLHAIQAQK